MFDAISVEWVRRKKKGGGSHRTLVEVEYIQYIRCNPPSAREVVPPSQCRSARRSSTYYLPKTLVKPVHMESEDPTGSSIHTTAV